MAFYGGVGMRVILLLGLFCSTFFHSFADEPREVRAIIFDFGGVISTIDHRPLVEYLGSCFQLSPSKALELLRMARSHSYNEGSDHDFWVKHLESLGYSETQTRFWLRQWERIRAAVVKEIPGMLDLVHALQEQGYETPLFSNVTEDWAKAIKKTGYYDHFEPLFLSCSLNAKKPDRIAFQMVLQDLNLPASLCLFIDDQPDNVKAAKEIGMDSILFIDLEQLVKELKKRGIEVQVRV
jgi:HAD superfamily hydrolase (TIGR01509 family)